MAATPIAQQVLRNRMPVERRRAFTSFVVVVIVLAVVLTVGDFFALSAVLREAQPAFFVLAGLAVASDALPVTLPGRWNTAAVLPSICFIFAIMIIDGLAMAIMVQTAAVAVASLRLRHALWRAVFNIAQNALALWAAYQVLFLTTGPGGDHGLVAYVGAASAWFVVTYMLTAIAVWLRDGGGFWSTALGPLGNEALATGALLMLGPVMAALAGQAPQMTLLMIVPLAAVRGLAVVTARQRHLANIDPLTGLANRKALIGEVRSAAFMHGSRAAHGYADRHFALLLLDLDRFKHVNDALGHEVGDRLLGAVADRLARLTPQGNLVARLGGDEFALVAKRLTGLDEARMLAERVETALASPVVLDGLPLDVSGSIGVAVFPEHGHDFATLLRHADVAMYTAKHSGDGVAIYAPETDHNSPQRLSLLADLRSTLANPEGSGLLLYYQPQVEIASGTVVGVEALLRWNHPVRGQVNPEELIKVAEPSSVMRLLTSWVLDQAITQLATWSAAGIELRVAVNVSVRDVHNGEIVSRIQRLLRQHGVPPDRLQLEITESALMADPHRVLATLTRLHRLGVGIALDDFGTGYSSLQHLRRLPLSEIKIDRSFVLGIADDADDRVIVASMIELAGALGLRVVAEGVEDESAWRLLHGAGCEVGQGWFYARPMPAEDLPGWLARNNSSTVASLLRPARSPGRAQRPRPATIAAEYDK